MTYKELMEKRAESQRRMAELEAKAKEESEKTSEDKKESEAAATVEEPVSNKQIVRRAGNREYLVDIDEQPMFIIRGSETAAPKKKRASTAGKKKEGK